MKLYIILLILLILLFLLYTSSKYLKNDSFNINPPTKTIEHKTYGIIKCISNDLTVCETILKGNTWEEELFNDYFKPYIKEDTTILDCGAYVGSHTILMKKLNRNNDIFVFEMMPEHYKIIQDNIKLNNFDNILTFNFALGEKIDRIKLPNINYNKNNNYGGIGFHSDKDNNIDMTLINLDYIIPFIRKPVSFMKVDVEGNELNLLRGAKELITKYKPIIEIEIWKNKYEELINSDIWKYLESLGYKIKNAMNDDYLIYY
jgi:FkbM family methyltransferase